MRWTIWWFLLPRRNGDEAMGQCRRPVRELGWTLGHNYKSSRKPVRQRSGSRLAASEIDDVVCQWLVVKIACSYVPTCRCMWFTNFLGTPGMPSSLVWLGASDIAGVQGTFRWQSTNELITYTNWESTSLPYASNAENCIMLNADNTKWSDTNCATAISSVCEIEYWWRCSLILPVCSPKAETVPPVPKLKSGTGCSRLRF